MEDNYIYVIVALLPLAGCMVVFEVNPYHALVIRGILGAIAALVYALFGAADVALTEALVGTMLAITLYAVAVRSSLVMRLGVLEDPMTKVDDQDGQDDQDDQDDQSDPLFDQLLDRLRVIFKEHYMRVELIPYPNAEELNRALMEKEVHATCVPQLSTEPQTPPYHTITRLQRLYEIMETELASPATVLSYINLSESGEKH